MHFITSNGYEINGALSMSTTRKIDTNSAVYRGGVISRKELGC
jgi:hypothetical protein